MSAPRTKRQMQAKVWAIIAHAKTQGCKSFGFRIIPHRTKIGAGFLRRLIRLSEGTFALFVLSHVENRVYRLLLSDLPDRALPEDLHRALVTMDPRRSAVVAFDVPHGEAGIEGEVFFAEIMYFDNNVLVTKPLAIFLD